LQKSRDILTLPQEWSHAFSLASALDFAARIHQLHKEEQLTQERAQALMALAREEGFMQRLATGTMDGTHLGWLDDLLEVSSS
jgi:hypothetical protein